MKYICNHPRTGDLMQAFADGHKLLVCKFYFWSSGTPLQRSQEGLLRSLLFELCRQDSALASVVSPSRPPFAALEDQYPGSWDRVTLLACLRKLASTTLEDRRFYFFIDGLDEYEGEGVELAEALSELGKIPNVKICLSSRRRNEFQQYFGQNAGQHLILHDHTTKDIEAYVRERLRAHPRFLEFCETHTEAQHLLEKITERAEGVFLWVALVVRSLARGLTNSDSVEDLDRRLQELPDDLDQFFTVMIRSIDKTYHEDSASLLLCCTISWRREVGTSFESLLLGLACLLDTRYNFALDAHGAVEKYLRMDKVEDMKRRISARSADLLEVVERCSKVSHSFASSSALRRSK